MSLFAEANKADCRRRKIGCVLVGDHGVIAVGHNRLLHGSCEAGDCPRGRMSYDALPALSPYIGNCDAVHAETSALMMAWAQGVLQSVREAFVTADPCPQCERALRECGVPWTVITPPDKEYEAAGEAP